MSRNGGDCLSTDKKKKLILHLYDDRMQECQLYFQIKFSDMFKTKL